MTQKDFRLSRPSRFLLRLFVDREMLASIEEDLEQHYAEAVDEHGPLMGRSRSFVQTFSILFSFVIESFVWRTTMLRSYLKVAWRHIRRRKVYSFINIIGLTVGMACFILIGLWVKDELSFDRFHENKDRIYRVLNRTEDGSSSYSITYALGPALKAGYPEVEEASRAWLWAGGLLKYEDKSFNENNIYLADPSFFKIFTFPFLKGDPETALDDKFSLVLTEETARKYFGDEDPFGKVLQYVGLEGDFTVTGVIENIPMNSHLRFDIMGRIEFLGEDRLARWEEWSGPNYVLLREGVSADDFETKIAGIYKKNVSPETTYVPVLQPLTRVYLYDYARSGFSVPSRVKRVYLFSVIAVFILLMACINFMNLSTAQSSKRAREVGMRKVIGARRQQVVRQFLGEAVLIAFLSLILALIAVETVLPHFNQYTGKAMALLSGANLGIVLTLVLITLGTGLVAGSYPALFLSSFQPAQTLKSQQSSASRGAGMRKGLIVAQFVISVGFIACTLVVSSQLRFIQKRDLGLDREQVVILFNNPILLPKYDAFKMALLTKAGIRNVTSAAQFPTRIGESISINWEGNPTDQMLGVDYTCVDYDFFKTFDMKILQGRSFSKEFPTDEKEACIINETAAKRMGLENPVGTNVYLGHPAWEESLREVRVIGVVNDFHARSLHRVIRPFVFRMYKPWHQYVFVKVDGDRMPETLAGIKAEFETYAPGYPFSSVFLDEVFNRQYMSERQLGNLFNVFSLLSVFIACLGLFGLASYTTEQKTKEIGIRKVLGASVPGIVALTAREFLKWVAVANLIAWPAAYYFMHQWLREFAYKVSIGPQIFVLAAGLTLVIALLTVSFHSLKAALSNPVNSLRYE